MKYIYALTALAGLASAHNMVTHFHVNGKADSSCVRIARSTNPITDLASNDMACNAVTGNAKSKCTVQAGDEVSFEWRADKNIPAEDYPPEDGQRVGVTDTSHMGPCAVYAKKVSDSLTAEGAGDGWFKIAEDGLDSNGIFCTTRLREADAPQPAKIPTTIEPGDYLLRAEFLTLNNAGLRSIGGQEEPQFYTGCIQVTIEGSSGTANPETVSIPGYVNIDTPGLLFDVWNSPSGTFKNYPMPGPKLFVDSGSSSPAAPSTKVKAPATATAVPQQPSSQPIPPQEPTPEEPTPEAPTPEEPTPEEPTPEEPTPEEPAPVSPPENAPTGADSPSNTFIWVGTTVSPNDPSSPTLPPDSATTLVVVTRTRFRPTATRTATYAGAAPTGKPAGKPSTQCGEWCKFMKIWRAYAAKYNKYRPQGYGKSRKYDDDDE